MTKKVALVSGGAVRLGSLIAKHLAKLGWDIALHYNASLKEALEVKKEIQGLGQRCELFEFDFSRVRQEGEYMDLCNKVLDTFSGLDLLVNNASIYTASTIEATTGQIFDELFNTNMKAPFFLSRAFYIIAKERELEHGNIINILDTKIMSQTFEYSVYLLTKKCLAEFTKMAAVEFGPLLRINAIAPSMIVPIKPREETKGYIDWLIRKNILKKRGSEKNFLYGLDYLLSNDFVTGQILYIDGGESINTIAGNFQDFQKMQGSL